MKKILFIIPCVPYPLNSGGNQAFFQMVDYIRHKMSVSVLFYAWTIDEAKRVEKLEDLWEDVDFYTFVKETKEEPDSPDRKSTRLNSSQIGRASCRERV